MKKIIENKIYLSDLKLALDKIDLATLKNSSILITGGLGLICSSIVDLIHLANLQGLNCKIYLADIKEEVFQTRYGHLEDIIFVKYDAILPIKFDFLCDYIICGAGIASPELYVNKPIETILSNFNGVLNLLNFSKENNVKKFLYISSSEVYGEKEFEGSFKEDSFGTININNIRSSYSEAKRISELLCKSFASELGVNVVMVRPGHIYGPTASENDKRISSAFAYLAAKGDNLVMNSAGLQKRSYCYCIDCAVAILTVLFNGKCGESYNIGHDEVTTIRDMAKIISKAGNVNLKLNQPSDEELKQFNPMLNSSLNNDKIKTLGYTDTFSVKEGLEHTVIILKELLKE